ncbi:MAG TPA: CbiX/SirB N-terminal domain-containing protein [Candidatus Limnocylindria bacterium]|nr:CbiX/SirB N-terminal domain-containing protein [Candidatus Limnocylindria bacterium]
MTVVLAAHGSPDPRHAAVMEDLRAAVEADLGDTRLGWLGHHTPDLPTVVSEALSTDPDTVVVPLLLAPAFHARVDVPAGAAEARIAAVLAPDERLLDLLDLRLGEALDRPPTGLILAAAGSTDPAADRLVRSVAQSWGSRHALPVAVAYASEPTTIAEAVSSLSTLGPDVFGVGAFFLAPGRLHDVVCGFAGESVVVTEPLGAHPLIADIVVDRATLALAQPVLRG